MYSYQHILFDVLEYGTEKFPQRVVGNEGQVDGSLRTIGKPNVNWEHHMENGFPLLTTKKMGLKNIAVELEFFIKGLTDKNWLQERKCHIWDEWSSPTSPWVAELGPIYGYQWRSFGKKFPHDDGSIHTDQLASILDTLKNKPQDRRMVCSAWNPNQIQHMALPPCHLLWNVTVYNDELHLSWHQRSCDLFLGVPYNIASYALLLLLLSKHAGLRPGSLAARFMDCHLYENQIDVAREQLERQPKILPTVTIPDTLKSGKPFSVLDWTYEDFELHNYNPHGSLKCDVVS